MASREELLGRLTDIEKKCAQIGTINMPPPKGMQHNDYREEIEKAKPSADPAYWAKPGCRTCYGKGVLGVVTTKFGKNNTLKSEQVCLCVTKRWQVWQDEFVKKLREEKFAAKIPDMSEQLPLPLAASAETVIEIDPRKARALERVDRLSARIGDLQVTLHELNERIANLPQRATVVQAEHAIVACDNDLKELRAQSELKEREAVQLDNEAERYQQLAKEAQRKAANLRQQRKSEVLPQVDMAQIRLTLAQQNFERAQQDLGRAEHQVYKKIREIKRKKEKFVARIERIKTENGFDNPVFIEETPERSVDSASPAIA